NPKLPEFGITKISYITGFDLAEKKRFVDPTKVKAIAAPQADLSRKVRPLLKEMKDDNWERTFYLIVTEIRDAKQIDPILRHNLLRQTLEVANRGSSVFDRAFGKHLDTLKEQNVNAFANWLDPKDEAAVADRRRAETALESLPDLASAGKAAADEIA